MAKIYVFGIGGTGSRVLRSLTMMLAAGVKFGADEIVPIIVDPDVANADLTRAVALFRDYSEIRKNLHFSGGNSNGFFKTEIRGVTPNYSMSIKDAGNKTFKKFIDLSQMSRENQAMAKMLFSDENLDSDMTVGFKGNPNIGSVVLNQFPLSDDFGEFANDFAQGDRIFIISSIFGGTGASGFPLLLNTLRLDNNIQNYALINNAKIGALTVLPYFRLQQNGNSAIDSSTFISKTKSALAYYEDNIVNNGNNGSGIDTLYYLGDDVVNTYANYEGGSAQQNEAHLIEFLGATAIINFSNVNLGGNAATVNMELGIKDINDASPVTFSSFYHRMNEMLYSPLTQFALMSNALKFKYDYYTSPAFNANRYFDGFYSGTFFGDLFTVCQKYLEWLDEMKKNKRSLDLFNLDCGNKPFELVTGGKPKKCFSLKTNYDLFTDRLNTAVNKCNSKNTEDKFLEMFSLATKRLISNKLK